MNLTKSKQIPINLNKSLLFKMYTMMLKIRKFEEKLVELLFAEEIKCPTHLYIGQEAIATGVCMNLRKEDYVFSTHRSHGHYIAKGGNLNQLMAEIYCRRNGCSKGKGGSMHVVAPEVGFMGSSAIVGGNIPLAVGCALASSLRNDKKVTVVFFGDGATDEGVFYESLNFASLYKLPVVFICENNLFSTHLPLFLRQPNDNIYQRARTYSMPAIRIDGNNVIKVYQTSKEAIERARRGGGPTLIECRTFRWRAHVGPWEDIDVGYRKKEEIEKWKKKCPIKRCERILLKYYGNSYKRSITKIHKQIEQEINQALIFARENSYPPISDLEKDVYKD